MSETLPHPLAVNYVGFQIPNKFVVGFGLDYDGYGRELEEILSVGEVRNVVQC